LNGNDDDEMQRMTDRYDVLFLAATIVKEFGRDLAWTLAPPEE